jgi:AraC-like DNA-binding protein
VTVTRTLVHDAANKMHYEFAYTVEAAATRNDFIDLFAETVIRHGKMPVKTCAAAMGVGVQQLQMTLLTLSGAGILEWMDAFAGAVSEALLRQTDWKVMRIAAAAGFGRLNVFSRWFRARYKCTPGEWR